MTIITPTPIAALPPAPVKGQAGFNAAAELYLSALVNPFTPQVNAAIAATNANALSAEQSAITAQAAAAGIDVPMWASGNNYQAGRGVKSPLAIAAGASPVYICKVEISGGTTDPYNDPAHWSIFTVSGGVGGAVYTTSTTLTASSPFAISISGGAGVWLKLPDATTLSTGIRHAVRNTGDNDLTVLNSAGAVIGFIRPQCGTTIALSDSSTAAGKWVGDWEIYGLTADLSLNLSIASNPIFSTAVKINQNKTMFLYGQTESGLYAVVYDTATQTSTDSLLVRTSSKYCQAVLIGGNVAVMTCDNYTSIQVALISPACIPLSTASASASGTVNSIGQFIALGNGLVFSYSTSAPAGIVRAISVSGTTLSIGAEVSLTSAEAPRLYISGNYLRVVRHNNSSGIYCTPYTLAGNVLTPGNAANTSAGTYYSDSVRTFQIDSGEIVVNHVYNGNLVCNIFRLNGSSESVSSVNLFTWSSGNYSIDFFSHVKMPDGRVCFGGVYNAYDLSVVYVTINAGIPSVSNLLYLRASNSTVRANSAGFFVSAYGFTFNFSTPNPSLNGSAYSANIGSYGNNWMDRLGRFNPYIVSNNKQAIAIGASGDLVSLFGANAVDNPQKNKITIPAQPAFRGDSASSSICCKSITTDNYGFRILMIKCID